MSKNRAKVHFAKYGILSLLLFLLSGGASVAEASFLEYGLSGRVAADQDTLGGEEGLALNVEVRPTLDFIYPLKVPMSLSGDYGELRGNHFHGGIDFRVGGVVGADIMAAESGYISKISVSPSGYGNALYITHPGGYVTVYGHLHRFVGRIEKFVRERQYENESFSLNIDLDSTRFVVTKGELIGYAGNSGSSGGPHLHFEIRDNNNVPLSVLERGMIKASDKLPPVFNRVEFLGFSQVYGASKSFMLERPQSAEDTIKVPMYFYTAVDAVDKMEGTNAKLAVNRYKVFLDTTLVYDLVIGEVPFNQGRYINSLIEYPLRRKRGKSFVKSYVEPGNRLDYKISALNDGVMYLTDSLVHRVKIEVYDYKNNKAVRSYKVQRVDSLFTEEMGERPAGHFMPWHLANFYEVGGLKLKIPAASLYSSTYLEIDTLEQRAGRYSPTWKIGKPEVPLHSAAMLSIRYDGPDSLASKALLASVGKNGRLYGAGGDYSEGYITGRIGSFGSYTVAVDLVRPTITPNFKEGAILKGNRISFIIKDALSGIKSYRVEIDGHWVLAEFDAKNARLSVPLEAAKIKRGIVHKLKIVVTDSKENRRVLTRSFKW